MSWLTRFQMSLSFHELSLSSVNDSELKEAMLTLIEMAVRKQIKLIIDRTFKFEEAEVAHKYLESGAVSGKVLLVR